MADNMGDTMIDSSETDEEFLAKYIANISSASSSISWAEDAVEAEMTKKIFGLWQDIQRVCTGEILDRPDDMTIPVYEECLSWKHAFPLQDVSSYSRYEEDLTPTSTPTKEGLSVQCPLFKPFSPQSPNSPDCVTPNPEKNASYVAIWLLDCQKQGPEIKEVDIADDMGSLSLFPTTRKSLSPNTVSIPYYQPPPTATRNLSNLRSSESVEPDPNNFFTSLALNNVVSSVDRLHGGGESNMNGGGELRVQRPISSNVNGHLITPLRTNYSNPSVSRSFRETGASSSSFQPNGNQNSRYPRSNVGVPKGKTAPVHPVCLPPIVSSCERSAGPRRSHSKSSNFETSNFLMPNSSGFGSLPNGREFYGSSRESGSKLSPSRTPVSGTFRPKSSLNNTSRVTENEYAVVGNATTWSRHSSISESYSFSVTNTEVPSKKSGVDTRYFETISENYSTQSSVKLSRPDFLPVSKEAELNPSRSRPVRPFLYWLLDKVSPS